MKSEPAALGTHLLLELKDCSIDTLKDLKKIKEILIKAAQISKATIIETAFHNFSPFGVSGMIIIAESHLAIHSYPEYGYASVDIFTCGNLIDPKIASEYIIKEFESKNPETVVIRRGILSPNENGKLPHKIFQGELCQNLN